MCKLCETKPVYEFTNQRKVCARCFINWFEKKFFYTIRKFGMISQKDVVSYENKGDFRGVVLEHMLGRWTERAHVKLRKGKGGTKIAVSDTSDVGSYEIVDSLIKGKGNVGGAVEGKIIRPLYLFLDAEVLLYARLHRLVYPKVQGSGAKLKKGKIAQFVDELEKKHPEVKHAVVKSWLKLS